MAFPEKAALPVCHQRRCGLLNLVFLCWDSIFVKSVDYHIGVLEEFG